jgi:hypothetical protein
MRHLVIWLASSTLGVLLVAMLPEDLFYAGRLFSLSTGHGPGVSDVIGIAIMLAGWAWFVRATWYDWRTREPRRFGVALALLAAMGSAGCLIAISANRNLAAIVFGSIAVAAQIALAIIPHCFAGKESK